LRLKKKPASDLTTEEEEEEVNAQGVTQSACRFKRVQKRNLVTNDHGPHAELLSRASTTTSS
jgi:hypothetical protein